MPETVGPPLPPGMSPSSLNPRKKTPTCALTGTRTHAHTHVHTNTYTNTNYPNIDRQTWSLPIPLLEAKAGSSVMFSRLGKVKPSSM